MLFEGRSCVYLNLRIPCESVCMLMTIWAVPGHFGNVSDKFNVDRVSRLLTGNTPLNCTVINCNSYYPHQIQVVEEK
jgi:hypothetical protein